MIYAESALENLLTKERFLVSKNHLGNTMTDPISDMIVRLKNASHTGLDQVSMPFSKMKFAIAEVLEKEGFIKAVQKKGKKAKKTLEVDLLYTDDRPMINDVKRVSKFSKRIYKRVQDIRPVRSGTGMLVLSTPKGVLSDRDAKEQNTGGEALFEIW